MRIFYFLLIFSSFSAHASGGLTECFKHEDNDNVSICLSKLYASKESARKIMERDFIDLVKRDKYLNMPKDYGKPLPDFSKIVKQGNLKAPVFDPNEDSETRKLKQMQHDMKRAKLQRQNQQKMQRLMNAETQKRRVEARDYESKKNIFINALVDSAKQFSSYRLIECDRQSSIHSSPVLAEITNKTCLYDMTNHRIKMLQRSMSR